ncbi:MFS transporter [Brevibacterium casei]|uniref:MFS transporter n=1 Tax=Brevibacterium casei TaxID=33889 RepID=UPI0011A6BC28|nr:MFS transporter [Brevibacterium casei]MCT1445888.1 MFS transporter [Brevibacterium casei]
MSTTDLDNRPRLTPKLVGGFIGSGVISLVAANFVPVFISGLTRDLGFDLGRAGLIATGLSLASVASMWVANFFVARHSRPIIAGVGTALMVIGFGLAAIFYSQAVVPLGLIVAGLGCGVMGAASIAAVSSTADPDRTTTVVALINRLAVSSLFLLAPIFFNDLRQVFVVLTFLGLVGSLIVRGLPNPPRELLTSSPMEETSTATRLRPIGIVLALAFGLWSMTEDMVYSLTAAVFGVHAGLSPEDSTSVLAYKVLGGLLGTIIAPFALRKLGRTTSIVLIVIISTVSKYLLITAENPVLYVASLVIWGIVYLTVVVLVLGLAANMDLSGRTGVFVNSFYIIGIACGPMIGGALQPHMSFPAYAILDCFVAVIAGAVIAVVSHREEKSAARSREVTGPDRKI